MKNSSSVWFDWIFESILSERVTKLDLRRKKGRLTELGSFVYGLRLNLLNLGFFFIN